MSEQDTSEIISLLDTLAATTAQGFNELREYVDKRFTVIENELIRHRNTFTSMEQQFISIDQRFDLMDKRFDKVDARLERIERKQDIHQSLLDHHDLRLRALEQ